MANSLDEVRLWLLQVVNCFQISNFVLWQTAMNFAKAVFVLL